MRDHIETRFVASPPVFGGVDLVLKEAEPDESQRVGRPYILFSITEGDAPEYGRSAVRGFVACPVYASDFAGGLVGVANPDAAQEVIASALQRLILEDYDALRELGLMATDFNTVGSGKTEVSKTRKALAYVEGRITFVYLTS